MKRIKGSSARYTSPPEHVIPDSIEIQLISSIVLSKRLLPLK